jgi:hypothetical protein
MRFMSTAPASPNHPPAGLPPVTPPNAGSFVQLFVTPLIIVIVLVGVAWSFHYFFGLFFGTPSPEQFIKKLDDPNAEVRWRTAADLAQVLLRDDRLASDPDFALKIADRLEKAHARNKDAEEEFVKDFDRLSDDDKERRRKSLQGERDYVGYLSACAGNFMIPVAAPVLEKLATQETGMEPKGLFQQRSQASWALILLGGKCQKFDKLPAVEQANILAKLDDAVVMRDHPEWAAAARDYLKGRQAGQPTSMGVDRALEKCAEAEQPYLRKLAAMGLNFWSGTDEENKRIEATLQSLSYDQGKGEAEQRELVGDNPDGTTALTRKPGRQVCYNATVALARRGSDKTRLDMLGEMLEGDQLREVFRLRKKDGSEVPEDDAVNQTVVIALETIAEMHNRNPKLVNDSLRDAVERLKSNGNPAISNQAKKTQQIIGAPN